MKSRSYHPGTGYPTSRSRCGSRNFPNTNLAAHIVTIQSCGADPPVRLLILTLNLIFLGWDPARTKVKGDG